MIRWLKRLWGLPGFLRAFFRSPEGREFRAGNLSYPEAVAKFNEREQAEHEVVMEGLRRKEWALNTKLGLTERKVDKLQQEIKKQ
jgi:hypothetical protein